MAKLRIKLTEPKSYKNVCKVQIKCTNDISQDVVSHTKDVYDSEMVNGYVKQGELETTIGFTLTCPVKIESLKLGITKHFLTRSLSDNLN